MISVRALRWSSSLNRKLRTVEYSFSTSEEFEGSAAFNVRRAIGSTNYPSLDPFMLLDHYHGLSGFCGSDHPHRGLETVTYYVKGGGTHQDSAGNEGTITAGEVQYMTAGRGIVHNERLNHDSEGLQLWVNLKERDKWELPRYVAVKKDSIRKVSEQGVDVTVVAGDFRGVSTPSYANTPLLYLDVSLSPGSEVTIPVPIDWNAFLYTIDGNLTLTGKSYARFDFAVLSSKESAVLISSAAGGRAALVAGQPSGEPFLQFGPFVMTTEEEINEAYRDYKHSLNGFEPAKGWKSSLKK